MPAATAPNGTASHPQNGSATTPKNDPQHDLLQLNLQMKNVTQQNKYGKFHGDDLIGDTRAPKGFIADWKNSIDDFQRILTPKNAPAIGKVVGKMLAGQGLDMKAGAGLIGSMSNDSKRRRAFIEGQVKSKYDKMLHPPLTYLGDAFQYRTADGKFNSVLHPHLGQAGAPYAKTVPSKTHQLGALPAAEDIFDRLMARNMDRPSQSGLSSMLIYHATIIIHDIFRTNESDKNISDSSSYLDLSPLYGYTMPMQKKIRDDRYKLGLLKPDTFAEDRLLRQPPGVCIMLVMYNRYHNYAATQLRRINENGRFSVPKRYTGTQLEAVARKFCTETKNSKLMQDPKFTKACQDHNKAWKQYKAKEPPFDADKIEAAKRIQAIKTKYGTNLRAAEAEIQKAQAEADEIAEKAKEAFKTSKEAMELDRCRQVLEDFIADFKSKSAEAVTETRAEFEKAYDDAWNKLDDDLFNTARLITCGMYIQVSIHDYLRALMGFHQFDTNFTLDPRLEIDHKNVSRGIGNQVTIEFNLLYRFHCAISAKDEKYTEEFMKRKMYIPDPKNVTLEQFTNIMKLAPKSTTEPWEQTFGLDHDEALDFQRNPVTGLFDDQKMINALTAAMDDPISNFGPQNVPKCLKPVEILGITQARKWEIGTLNDFREFFGMPRHETFESITDNAEVQHALRDLYEHPDKVELYPGVFCESDKDKGLDPGPSDVDSALWAAIFSDAITLVRSDRFYTVDWNTNSLTSWGMKEVTPDNNVLKSSVFHRLIQRAFPEWWHYDSVNFFHPFYTSEQNAKFAKEQGYGPEFRISPEPVLDKNTHVSKFDVTDSKPRKPWKPVYLNDFDSITAVLTDRSYDFVHPSLRDPINFPPELKDVFDYLRAFNPSKVKSSKSIQKPVPEDIDAMLKYFNDLMQYIVKRESISMSQSTYQIDATRDFAIPVVTRYVADFLGFGHLIRSEKHPKAPHSENEIYQHITNCQTFLSYNVDETKLLKRRKAFRSSLAFLYDLTLNGCIQDVNRFEVTKYFFPRAPENYMSQLGRQITERVLSHVPDADKAAMILVLVGLHTAYNTVLAFTSVLNKFIEEMYVYAKAKEDSSAKEAPKWLKVQELAFQEDKKSLDELTTLVMQAERASVRLPIVRSALKNHPLIGKDGKPIKTVDGKDLIVEKGNLIIMDMFEANKKALENPPKVGKAPQDAGFPNYQISVTDQFADYHPKHVSVVSLTAMIRFFARMKNVRRGHDAQGRVKKVNLDCSSEGYSNYMAPMRMSRIASQVETIKSIEKERNVKIMADADQAAIYTRNLLRPAMDTFLTVEWDEMVPFPNTWKLRFEGFGQSHYFVKKGLKGDEPYNWLHVPDIYDHAPPFYQPQGASHVGGSFADVVCVCNTPGVVCHCKDPVAMAAAAAEAEKNPDSKPALVETPADRAQTVVSGCGLTK